MLHWAHWLTKHHCKSQGKQRHSTGSGILLNPWKFATDQNNYCYARTPKNHDVTKSLQRVNAFNGNRFVQLGCLGLKLWFYLFGLLNYLLGISLKLQTFLYFCWICGTHSRCKYSTRFLSLCIRETWRRHHFSFHQLLPHNCKHSFTSCPQLWSPA